MPKTSGFNIMLRDGGARVEVGDDEIQRPFQSAKLENRRTTSKEDLPPRRVGELLQEGVLDRYADPSATRHVPWGPPRGAARGIAPNVSAALRAMRLSPQAHVVRAHEAEDVLGLFAVAQGVSGEEGLAIPRDHRRRAQVRAR